MRKTVQKGTIAYMPAQKKKEIILTICYFAISFAIYAIGYLTTKTRANLLTVVAVLGLLPSSKSAVRMIMFLRAPKFSLSVNDTLCAAIDSLDAVYGLVLTVYEGTYPLSCIAIRGQELCAYSEFMALKTDACEEHIQTMLKQNGFTGIHVKVMTEENKFLTRISQLAQNEKNGKEEEMLQLMCDISL